MKASKSKRCRQRRKVFDPLKKSASRANLQYHLVRKEDLNCWLQVSKSDKLLSGLQKLMATEIYKIFGDIRKENYNISVVLKSSVFAYPIADITRDLGSWGARGK